MTITPERIARPSRGGAQASAVRDAAAARWWRARLTLARRSIADAAGAGSASPSGGRGDRSDVCCDDLLTLRLGEPAPDAVGLMHLQRVPTALEERRASRTDGLRLRLAPCARRAAFALRVEEVCAGHAAACRVKLPIPQVGIRSRKTSGIGHRSSPLDLTSPRLAVSRQAELTRRDGRPPRRRRTQSSESRGDAGIADDLTIDRTAMMIKTVGCPVSHATVQGLPQAPSRPRRAEIRRRGSGFSIGERRASTRWRGTESGAGSGGRKRQHGTKGKRE